MIEITAKQSKLVFSFDDEKEWAWVVSADEHIDVKKIKTIPSLKDVDIIAVYKRDVNSELFEDVVLMEITNYKQSKSCIPILADFANEFAEKVKDTLAIIVSGARNSTHSSEEWLKALKLIIQKNEFNSSKNRVCAVVWLEEDLSGFDQREVKMRKTNLIEKLEQKLKWLTSNIWTTNLSEHEANPIFQNLFVKALKY